MSLRMDSERWELRHIRSMELGPEAREPLGQTTGCGTVYEDMQKPHDLPGTQGPPPRTPHSLKVLLPSLGLPSEGNPTTTSTKKKEEFTKGPAESSSTVSDIAHVGIESDGKEGLGQADGDIGALFGSLIRVYGVY